MSDVPEAVNYGITKKDYLLGLEAELAAATDADRKAAVQAEIDAVKGTPDPETAE